MATGVRRTVIDIKGARWRCPAWSTETLKSRRSFKAASSIVARIRKAGMFRNFTVLSRVPLWAGTLILVRAGVAAGTSVQTRWVSPTIVQIFIAELATPVGLTEALPRFVASAMDTARVRNALIAVLALPSVLTPALSRNFARPVFGATTLTTDGFVAFEAHPAFQTSFVAILITGVVSKEVVPWPAKLVAAKAIIMLITRDSNLVLKMSNTRILLQGLPLPAGVDHSRVRSFFDNVISVNTVVTVIPGFHQQRVRSRPGEAEGQDDPVPFVSPRVL